MYTYNATVINVVDGDTIDAMVDLGFSIHHKVRIRLAGVDTPEMRDSDLEIRARAQAAKAILITELIGSGVMLEVIGRDKYGRWVGHVTSTEIGDVSKYLIENNFGVPYPE